MKNSYKIKANKIMTHAQFFEFCKRYNLDVQYCKCNGCGFDAEPNSKYCKNHIHSRK